eukprot:1146660-Pelagomonas_calceolata.AAC.6
MSTASRMTIKLACGGALCGSATILHPFWQKKGNPQTCAEQPALRDFSFFWAVHRCRNVRFCQGYWGSVSVGSTIRAGEGLLGITSASSPMLQGCAPNLAQSCRQQYCF